MSLRFEVSQWSSYLSSRLKVSSNQRFTVPPRVSFNLKLTLYVCDVSLESVIHSDPEILGGTPVFTGTRVPVQSLFQHLESGDSIDDFLEGFPSVRREQVIAVLEELDRTSTG